MTTPPLALGTFSNDGGAPFAGLVLDGRVVDLRPHFGDDVSTLAMLDDWDASLRRLGALAEQRADSGRPVSELRACAPVSPRQILCAGANYRRHVAQMAFAHLRKQKDGRSDEALREAAEQEASDLASRDPFLFAGLPSALCGAQDDIVLWGPGHQHDWELELTVVIGRGGRYIPVGQAMDHVAGYMISNDISTRDLLLRPNFPMSDLVMTKNRPTFFPTGPYIVPRAALPDPSELRLTLRVNGEVMQDETTADMMHGIDRLIAYASRAVELYPGDLLLTGSPAGNAGHHGNRWLRPGDLIEGDITGIGTLCNRCVAPPESAE